MRQMIQQSDITKCWGKKKDCHNKSCQHRETCFNKLNESREDLHYQYQHISVPSLIYDPQDGEQSDETTAAYFSAEEDLPTETPLELSGITLPPSSVPVVMSVLERVAEFYFHTPNVFEALMNSVFRGKSQSDLAKEKHVTRQCINKRLLQELTIAQKSNDIQERRDRALQETQEEYRKKLKSIEDRQEFLKKLSPRDLQIYHCRFTRNYTAKHTAILCKCDIRTVFRVSQFIRRKMQFSVMKSGRRKKKHEKNNTDND
jgi:hypothetical protein